MVSEILYAEINLVCCLVLFLLRIKVHQSMFLQDQRLLLSKVILSNNIFLILDALWIFVDHNLLSVSVAFNWIINALYFCVSGILGYYWFNYSETVQNSQLVRKKKYQKIICLPMLILIVLTACSLKTGWVFYIDASNHYHRGSLYALQVLIGYGYVAFTAIKGFILSFRANDFHRRQALRTVAFFGVPTLLAGLIQTFGAASYPTLCVGNTLGILYVYLTMQEQLISLDALTKLNNRNQLFQYLSTKLTHIREDKTLYLLIMDVDYFKSINDQYGHVEGDQALRLVAQAMMRACSNRNYFISRYGGDEFVAICELEPGDSVQPFCDHIHRNLREIDKPYQLSLSIGYARYTSDIRNQQDFIDRADQELYRVKKSRKAIAPNE